MKTTFHRINGEITHRITLIADVHDFKNDHLFESVNKYRPDIIVVAGDIVNGISLDKTGFKYDPSTPMLTRFPNADKLIQTLPNIAPTFFSYGNHEWMLNEVDVERIQSAGVVILHNTFIRYSDLVIGGLSSPDVTHYWFFQKEWRAEHPDDTKGNLRRSYYCWKTHEERKMVDSSWLPEFEKQEGYKILICHHPEYWALKEPKLCERPIDLVLSGHAHGGQIRIGGQGLYASGQGWFPKYTSGVHHGKYGDMIISRGLSNTNLIPRLFNPTEIVHVDVIGGRQLSSGGEYRRR